MKLSRERKIFVIICALALVALVVDRTLLGEASAEEAAGGDPSALLIGGSAASPSRSVTATPRKAADGASSSAAISSLLAEMADRNRRQLEQTPDAFQPGAGWAAPDLSQPAPPASDMRVETFAKRKLASIVAGGRGKAGAMLDGVIVLVGQSIDGFTLVSVDSQSAVFEGRSVQVRLSLAGEARITTARAGSPGATRTTTAAPTGTLSGR